MKIREIKRKARITLNLNRKLYFKLSSIQALITLISMYIGAPMLIQILQYESLRSEGINTQEPNTFVFAMIFAAYQIITVMIQSILIAYMTLF